MHLINDKYLVFSLLWLETNLLNERSDMLHTVVRSSIQFGNIEGGVFIEGLAGIAGVARFDRAKF